MLEAFGLPLQLTQGLGPRPVAFARHISHLRGFARRQHVGLTVRVAGFLEIIGLSVATLTDELLIKYGIHNLSKRLNILFRPRFLSFVRLQTGSQVTPSFDHDDALRDG